MDPREQQARQMQLIQQQQQQIQQMKVQQLQQNSTPQALRENQLGPPGTQMTPQQLQQFQQMQKIQQLQQLARLNSMRTPVGQQNPNPQFSTPGQMPAGASYRQFQQRPASAQSTQKRGIVLQNSQRSNKHNLLPPRNTYAPRLKLGYTSLIKPIIQTDKKRKAKFTEEVSDEESYEDESFTDSEADSPRRSRRVTSLQQQETTSVSTQEIVPPLFELKKRKNLLSTTKHDFEKINLCRLAQFSSNKEVLVPIQIEFEQNGQKYTDQFSWNLNEKMISSDKFAEYLCDDLNLNPQNIQMISQSIKNQLDEHKRFFQVYDLPLQEDTRILIKLDLTSGKVRLRDKFEWDLCGDILPEEFAATLSSDLSLGGEFITLIAHSIREQIFRARQIGEFETTFAIEKPFRSEEEAKTWCPFVDCGDLEGLEDETIEQDRKQRFLKLTRLLRRQQRLNENQKRRGYSAYENIGAAIPNALNMPHVMEMPVDERKKWRCLHCACQISKTNDVLDGPQGKLTLCKSCGTYYSYNNSLPEHRFGLFK